MEFTKSTVYNLEMISISVIILKNNLIKIMIAFISKYTEVYGNILSKYVKI